jgi:hypothetical protein
MPDFFDVVVYIFSINNDMKIPNTIIVLGPEISGGSTQFSSAVLPLENSRSRVS